SSGQPPPAGDSLCGTPNGATATCSVPLTSPEGTQVAELTFDVPLDAIDRAETDAQHGLWLASALVLLVGSGAAWLLARSLTRPLANLTAAAERIQAGNMLEPVQVQTSDEVGVLATAFERMRARVAEVTGSLRDERDVLDAVLESAGVGILLVDQLGT